MHPKYSEGFGTGRLSWHKTGPGAVSFCTTLTCTPVGAITGGIMSAIPPKFYKEVDVRGMSLEKAAFNVGFAKGMMKERNKKIWLHFGIAAFINLIVGLISIAAQA